MPIYATRSPKPSDAMAFHAAVIGRSDHRRSAAEESWDNEGGCAFVTAATRLLTPDSRARAFTELNDLTAQLRAMTQRLNDDFVNARIGVRHQTYEHRSRMVRQLKGRLDMALLAATAAA
jgi:chemotaxis protein histidine kinase CheA